MTVTHTWRALLTLAWLVSFSIASESSSATKLYEQHALTHAGDVLRGKELFFNESLTKCAVCHSIDGKGGDAGPDLSAIGGKYDRPHLIESLLEPSRQIVEGYRSTVCVLSSGRVVTGVIRDSSDQELTIVDVEGRRYSFRLTEIEQRHESDASLMPAGLEQLLSLEQFTDLIAFLESCRTGIKGTPGSHVAGGIQLPEGFHVETMATGLTGATALETLRDGRVLICEQTGTLRVVVEGKLLPEPVLSLPVEAYWERGLIGVTVDPDFERNGFVYLCYVAKDPYPHHCVSRFVMTGNSIDPAGEMRLLEGDDQRRLGGNVPAGHQGGALHFGLDGTLYIAIGEQTAEEPSQRLDTFQGKLLRIHPDGTIPHDNPFVSRTSGKYQAIWAIGLRNPFTFAIRANDGTMCINDVGGNRYEEINLGAPGANFGWPRVEGPSEDKRFTSPIYWYKAASVCGGDFVAADSPWPAEYRGRYIFADYVHGWIKTLDVEHPQEARPFAAGFRNPVDLRFAADGSLYVLVRNAWVIDRKFPRGTGSLLRIRYARERASSG